MAIDVPSGNRRADRHVELFASAKANASDTLVRQSAVAVNDMVVGRVVRDQSDRRADLERQRRRENVAAEIGASAIGCEMQYPLVRDVQGRAAVIGGGVVCR